MAEGKQTEYEKIKATNVFEFYNLLKLWSDKTKNENEKLKHQKR